MNQHGRVLRIARGVQPMQMLRALDGAAAHDGKVIAAGVEVGPQHLSQLVDDGVVRLGLVETEDGLEADRLEVTFFLRLLQRIGVDVFAIDAPSVLAERSRGELDDRRGPRRARVTLPMSAPRYGAPRR